MNLSEPKKAKIWQEILDSSAKMEEVAQKNDWQQLAKLVDNRQKLLNKFFRKPVAESQVQALHQIQADIQLILEQDKRTRKSFRIEQCQPTERHTRLKQR